MDQLINALMERNIVAWVVAVLALVICLKLLQGLGKGLLILLIIAAVVFGLMQFFPELFASISDFVGGKWLGDSAD